MNIMIFSREQIESGICPKNSILISITDLENKHPEEAEEFLSILKLKFDDVDGIVSNTFPISEKDAKEIVDFVLNNKEKIENICVNCDAGLSRSAGVAAAISKILNKDDTVIFKAKPLINKLCYRKVLDYYLKNYC